jgi:hypothetical protein
MEDAMRTFELSKEGFGEHTRGCAQVFDWFSKFNMVVTCVEDAEISGCPLTAKQIKVWIE